MNADHFLLSGKRASQHNIFETKSIKPSSTFHFFCSWFLLIAIASSQPLSKGFSPCFKHLLHSSQSSYSSRALLSSVSSHNLQKKKGKTRCLATAYRLNVRRALRGLQAPSQCELELPLLSYFLLHLFPAQFLTQYPSCSPPHVFIHPGPYTRNAIYFVSKCQNPM